MRRSFPTLSWPAGCRRRPRTYATPTSAGLFALLLTASLLPPAAHFQPRASETGEDFPPEDYLVWLMVERGLKDRAAALRAELTLLDRQEDLLARIATLETYGFSVFAAQVARATLQSIVGSPAQAEKLMSNALTWKVTGSSGHWIQ